MTFTKGVMRARSHIVFLVGLCAAFTLIVHLDALGARQRPISIDVFEIATSEQSAPAKPVGALTAQEEAAAQTAWVYFENNLQPETGLVNSVDGYPSTTMWDQASYMLALISAYRLDVIDSSMFDRRMTSLLTALAALPLFDGALPNKAYSTTSLAMTDYEGQVSERGIGWSALDIGRIMVPLNIVVWNYPRYAGLVKDVVQHWQIDAMLDDGFMIGTRTDASDRTERVQEGRIGYEEYAAASLGLLGYDAKRAGSYTDFLQFEPIYGVDVPVDVRDVRSYGAHNYVVSEPYILAALEYGWTSDMQEFAYRVYAAQEQRFRRTGQLTAVSEDNVDRPPYFVYNTVFANGRRWNTISEDGEDVSDLRSVSTKAAFGWYVLYPNDYTTRLVEKVIALSDPEKGFYSGWYEVLDEPNTAITANTNGIILQSLHFKKFGKLVQLYTD